jgi:penicillin-binding protein 2
MIERDTDRSRSFARRTALIGGIKVGILGALASRLYYLQVVEAEGFKTLAEDNRINMRLIAPSRGQIVDRFGRPLAINNQNFRVLLVPEGNKDVAGTLNQLSTMFTLTEADIRRVMRDIERKRAFVPVLVRENLTWNEVSTVEVNAPDLPGISIDVGELRVYPHADILSHVLGYVGAVSESELTGDPVLALPGFRIGKSGIEKQHDLALRGKAGASNIEVNSVGRVIRELSREEGEQGRQVALTLDVELQRFAHERLSAERSAAAVIMDVHTGSVYALASTPSFDPNVFSKGIPADLWEELLNEPTSPLTNKAIAGQYPPGSTYKMVTALAGLESGAINLGHRVGCPGYTTLGNFTFHCWKKGGHGTVGLVEALAQSCDCFFYDVGKRAGIDKLAVAAKKLGIGIKLGFDVPGERPGIAPTQEWKRARFGQVWHQGETLVNAIGQGYTLATPLQLAVMTARLVNGGFAVVPHITKQVGSEKERVQWPSLGIPKQYLDALLKGMQAVTTVGTAARSQIREAGFEMGGKTGTAQVKRITAAERQANIKQESLPWRYRHHALFVGYAPLHAPRYSCSVIVEHGIGGSVAAAPIARDLLLETQKRDPARLVVAEGAHSRQGGG